MQEHINNLFVFNFVHIIINITHYSFWSSYPKYKQLKSGGVDCDEDVDVDIDDEEEEGESGGVVSDYDAQSFQKVVGWSNEDKKLLDELDNEDEEEEDEEEEEGLEQDRLYKKRRKSNNNNQIIKEEGFEHNDDDDDDDEEDEVKREFPTYGYQQNWFL